MKSVFGLFQDQTKHGNLGEGEKHVSAQKTARILLVVLGSEPPPAAYLNRLQCVECDRVSREGERGSTARLTVDDEVVVYCPECDEREFRQ